MSKYVKVDQSREEFKPINPDLVTKLLNPLGTVIDAVGGVLNKLGEMSIVYSTFDYKGSTHYAHDEYEHRLCSKDKELVGYGKWVKVDTDES